MRERRLEILGILTLTVSLLVLVSLLGYHPNEDPGISPNVRVENPMGILGVYIAYAFIKLLFGYSSLVIPLVGLVWGWWFFSHRSLQPLARVSAYLLGAVLLVSMTLGLVEILTASGRGLEFQYSGWIGGSLAKLLYDFLGTIGLVLVLSASWLMLVRGYFSWSFYTPLNKMGSFFQRKRDERALRRKMKATEEAKREHTRTLVEKIDSHREPEPSPQPDSTLKANEEQPGKKQILTAEESLASETGEKTLESAGVETGAASEVGESTDLKVEQEVIEQEVNLDELKARHAPRRKYQLPPTDILSVPQDVYEGMSREELIERANFLTQSLLTFGVEGTVVNVSPGPVITLFEVEPAEGVRVNKFVALSDDLARVMEASRVRVIAPIPGKSSVGIEIPNRHPAMVYFRSVINSKKFADSPSLLTLAIGKTTSGEIATLDLAKMPHLLIAGTTGSGKSVCLNSIICSILYRATPEEVKFVIIDPKKVEMSLYRKLNGYHLLKMEDIPEPIVTTMENAVLALRSVEQEMGRRYDILAESVVRNIDEYNAKMRASNQPPMPYIIVVVDELADLMMLNAREVEAPIARLAQLARAVGIHLVIATQRPSVDVITGLIKANFPSRIAFQVASKIDSRTIIDGPGAEKLIGRGDMLYLGSGSSDPVRLHNAYITLEEIEALMNHITQQPTPEEELVLPTLRESVLTETMMDNGGSEDELLTEAIRLVVTHQQGSISLIQRRLKVGYSRAARLIDQMEQLGIVGPFTGSKAREILVDESYLEHL
jgi:S-DNA-T family DNA segregation ATPase FtsK/SpoIIIE